MFSSCLRFDRDTAPFCCLPLDGVGARRLGIGRFEHRRSTSAALYPNRPLQFSACRVSKDLHFVRGTSGRLPNRTAPGTTYAQEPGSDSPAPCDWPVRRLTLVGRQADFLGQVLVCRVVSDPWFVLSKFLDSTIAGTSYAWGTWFWRRAPCRGAGPHYDQKVNSELGPYPVGNGLSKRKQLSFESELSDQRR